MKVKGLVFRSYLGTFKRLRGDEAHARLLDHLPQELGDTLRTGGIVTGQWYPVSWLAEVQAAARRACNEGPEMTRAIAREGIRDDFRAGVHRLVTLALSPEWIFKSAPKLVGFYYDSGRLVVEEAEPGRVMGRFEGFTGFTHDLWEALIGGSVGILEQAGARGPVAKVLAGGGDGDAHLTCTVRWR